MAETGIDVVWPVARRAGKAAANAVSVERHPVPPGAVLGLVDNTKARAADLLHAIGRALVARGVVADYFLVRKPTPSRVVADDERARLLADADVIVSGVGDCGNCTSCSVGDAALGLDHGKPAAVIVTTEFVRLSEVTRDHTGAFGLDIVAVEHPIWTRDDAWFDATAAVVADDLAARWGVAAAVVATPV